jgi:hypothetical protein
LGGGQAFIVPAGFQAQWWIAWVWSRAAHFPDINFAVVALANTAGTANFADQKLAYHLIDGKLDVPVERFDWDKE